MPSPTYVALAKTVLTGTQATVTFSSIVGTYTDLLLVASIRDTAATTTRNLQWRINGTTTTYTQTEIQGNGSAASSTRRSGATYFSANNTIPASTATSNTFGSVEIYIPNYTSSTNKVASVTSVGEQNGTTAYIMGVANLWSTTSAITQIEFIADNVYDVGSRFDLYGIKNS